MQFLQVTVDSLHKNLVDSELGFKECTSITKDASWKQKFELFAMKREQMMRDLEIYGGASKSASGTVKGGLSRAWTDIKSSLSGGGQNITDSIWKEEENLKKAYENALKSHGIASSLNGLLIEHIRKIDSDLIELRSMFGIDQENKTSLLTEQAIVNTSSTSTLATEQQQQQQKPQHSVERRQSIGDKIKATFGIGVDQHEKAIEKQRVNQQQLSGRGFV